MPNSSDFRAPPVSSSNDQKIGWHREACVQAGQQWLKGQRAYASIAEAKRLILDSNTDVVPHGQSAVNIPRAKRQIRELVSIMANLRPTASNKTDNIEYQQQADVLNAVDRSWWYSTFADRRFRDAFQAAAVTGTVYVSHVWDPDLRGFGRGDIRTDVYGADEVYLINPPRDHNIQSCYAVVFCHRVPIHLVHQRYPLLAHLIVPDHGTQAYTQQGLDYVQGFMNSPMKHLSGKFDTAVKLDDVFPTCDVYETYIYDLSVNLTDHEVTMGEQGTSWEYKVPSFGSQILTGTNSWEGLPNYRKATIDDARLYPLRRRMICTSTVCLEDGTSPWWCGLVPATRFSFDDWWCEALGFPLSRDVQSIEQDANELLRGISDGAKVALDPPMTYDENLVSERLAQRLNPRLPGQRLKGNMQMGDMMKALLPPGYSNLPVYIPELVKYLNEQQDFIIGVRDLVAMAKARQVPSSDSLEKIAEMAGPLSEDMTRSMERGMRDLGEFRRWLNFQFRTKKQRLQILGENGLTEQDYDFDPGTIIPSHLPDEDQSAGPSRYTAVERARQHAGNFYYHVVAGSMGRLQSMSNKLLLLQLQARGFPLDPWTLAELYEIDNFGAPPEGTKDIMTRWIAWQHIQHELAAELQGMVQGPETRGRPASGNLPPRIRQKEGGTRSTISQSG